MISYGLYFDGIDDIDDEEHVGDFDAFSSRHSQYLAFSLDDGGLSGPGDKGRYPWPHSIDFRCIYSFTRSVSYRSQSKITLRSNEKKLYILFIYTVRSVTY